MDRVDPMIINLGLFTPAANYDQLRAKAQKNCLNVPNLLTK